MTPVLSGPSDGVSGADVPLRGYKGRTSFCLKVGRHSKFSVRHSSVHNICLKVHSRHSDV